MVLLYTLIAEVAPEELIFIPLIGSVALAAEARISPIKLFLSVVLILTVVPDTWIPFTVPVPITLLDDARSYI